MGKIEITKKVLGICCERIVYTVVDTETKEALIIDPAGSRRCVDSRLEG